MSSILCLKLVRPYKLVVTKCLGTIVQQAIMYVEVKVFNLQYYMFETDETVQAETETDETIQACRY